MKLTPETQINKLLASDHYELDEILAGLFAAFETENAGQIYKNLDLFWARLAMHIRAEHLHLFPAILRCFELNKQKRKTGIPTFEAVRIAIERLREDHSFFMNELATAIKQMRELTEDSKMNRQNALLSVRGKITVLRRRLKKHNELEETEIYRLTNKMLNPSECGILYEKIQKELDNLPPRFRKQ